MLRVPAPAVFNLHHFRQFEKRDAGGAGNLLSAAVQADIGGAGELRQQDDVQVAGQSPGDVLAVRAGLKAQGIAGDAERRGAQR